MRAPDLQRIAVVQRDDTAPTLTLDDLDETKVDATIAGLIGVVRANYVDAISNARSRLITASINEATKKNLFQNITLAAGSLLLPPALNVIARTLQGTLKQSARSLFKTAVMYGPAYAEPERARSLAAFDQIIDERFTPSAITGYVASAQSILTSKEFDVYGNNKYERTASYLDGLSNMNAASMTDTALKTLHRTRAESLMLLSMLTHLAQHNEIYAADVLTRSTHFLTQVADVVLRDTLYGNVVGPQLCKIAAYGRDRWARVQVGQLNGWVFLEWVDPDVAQTLDASRGDKPVPRLKPSDIAGHLPDPVLEGGGQRDSQGAPMRTEWTNAWGGPRLVEVSIPENLQGKGVYMFRRWVPAAEQYAAIARGQLQAGGIDEQRMIPQDSIRGKTAPTEPPLR